MQTSSGRDSLAQVELVMALEIELGSEAVAALPPDQAALLHGIVCWPRELPWMPPEPGVDWPATVRVVGERDCRVLFLTGRVDRIGVGCRNTDGRIDAARLYPSLQRALFAFARLECPGSP
jgi:hypothetical protein